MNNAMTIAAETSNEILSMEVSALKDTLACYQKIIELRKAVAMLTKIQPRLGATAQRINSGRLAKAKADLAFYLEMV